MNVVIIEDNIAAQELIQGLLRRHFPQLQVSGVAATVQTGRQLIDAVHPDLLLLDVQLRDGTVFDLLEQIDPTCLQTAELIFITAFGTYENIYRALRLSAIDYLIKPIDEQHFCQAVGDALERRGRAQLPGQLTLLQELLGSPSGTNLHKIAIHLPKGVIELLSRDRIVFLQGEDNITYVHLVNGQRMVAMRNVGYYESSLPSQSRFFRISKQAIINLDHLIRFNHQEHEVTLTAGITLRTSRRCGKALGELIRGQRHP